MYSCFYRNTGYGTSWCLCVYLPTIVFAHQAGEGVRKGGGGPAVPLTPRVAVLPTFLL